MGEKRWIVVGTDFSDGAARALESAVKLAAKLGASVACVHAYEDATDAPAVPDPAPNLLRRMEEVLAQCSAFRGASMSNPSFGAAPPGTSSSTWPATWALSSSWLAPRDSGVRRGITSWGQSRIAS
jgi:hypothetical protein